MEAVGVAIVTGAFMLLVVVVMQNGARERDRRNARDTATLMDRALRAVGEQVALITTPVVGVPLEGTANGARVDGTGGVGPQIGWDALGVDDGDDVAVDPINLDKPLDNWGGMFDQEDGGAVPAVGVDGVGVDVLAAEMRERAVIVEPGFDPVEEMRARAEAAER